MREEISADNRLLSESLRRKYESYYSLENILNHPIILAIDESELMAYPVEMMELCFSSYKQIYQKKSDFMIQR